MAADASHAIAAFALAAVPGVIVVELLEYRRPPIRERTGARAFALYLIHSLVAWGVAILLLDAGGRLGAIIDADPDRGAPLIDAYMALAWRLVVVALGVGILLRCTHFALNRYAYQAIENSRLEGEEGLSWLGRISVGLVSVVFAWDDLLARLKRAATPQIVHVRFRDGSEVYGVLAQGGRADFHADGRGIVLDAELVEENGRLVQIPGSSGVFINADAVASVGFIDFENAGSVTAHR